MSKKPKIIVWNKKTQKIGHSKFLKPRRSEKSLEEKENIGLHPNDKLILFAKRFDAAIRNAAKKN